AAHAELIKYGGGAFVEMHAAVPQTVFAGRVEAIVGFGHAGQILQRVHRCFSGIERIRPVNRFAVCHGGNSDPCLRARKWPALDPCQPEKLSVRFGFVLGAAKALTGACSNRFPVLSLSAAPGNTGGLKPIPEPFPGAPPALIFTCGPTKVTPPGSSLIKLPPALRVSSLPASMISF